MLIHKAFSQCRNKKISHSLLLELRDFCEITGDCREFAYTCIRNFCECAEGYRADERNKTCVGGESQLKWTLSLSFYKSDV